MYGNGGYKPIPFGDITRAPNGTYGAITPPFGSLGNSNTTPQISGTKVIKGDNYIRYENPNGSFTVIGNGQINTGWG